MEFALFILKVIVAKIKFMMVSFEGDLNEAMIVWLVCEASLIKNARNLLVIVIIIH